MKYLEDLNEFNAKIKRIEKLLLIAKFFKNKKLILTTLEEQHSAGKSLLVLLLKFNHAKGNITLTDNPEKNIEILKEKVSKDWEIEKHVESLLKLMDIHKKHKKSPIEFMKKGFVVILDENQNIEKINLNLLKEFQQSIKSISKNFRIKITEISEEKI